MGAAELGGLILVCLMKGRVTLVKMLDESV